MEGRTCPPVNLELEHVGLKFKNPSGLRWEAWASSSYNCLSTYLKPLRDCSVFFELLWFKSSHMGLAERLGSDFVVGNVKDFLAELQGKEPELLSVRVVWTLPVRILGHKICQFERSV